MPKASKVALQLEEQYQELIQQVVPLIVHQPPLPEHYSLAQPSPLLELPSTTTYSMHEDAELVIAED